MYEVKEVEMCGPNVPSFQLVPGHHGMVYPTKLTHNINACQTSMVGMPKAALCLGIEMSTLPFRRLPTKKWMHELDLHVQQLQSMPGN